MCVEHSFIPAEELALLMGLEFGQEHPLFPAGLLENFLQCVWRIE